MNLKDVAKIINDNPNALLETIRRERPYRTPKGYLRWEVISALIALEIKTLNQKQDIAAHQHSCKSALWLIQDAPIYCLTPSLLQAFNQSDVLDQKELFTEIQPPLSIFMLLFPQGMVNTPTENHLDWMIVNLVDEKNLPCLQTSDLFKIQILSTPNGKYERVLHCSGVDSNNTTWFFCCGISENGEIINGNCDLGANPLNDSDWLFGEKMRSLALQSLLAITYAPELLEEQEKINNNSNSKAKNYRKAQKPVVRYPRWLGKTYQRKRQGYLSSERSSPRGHWRKGHQRRVAVGKGRTERKWRWFEPTWVGD